MKLVCLALLIAACSNDDLAKKKAEMDKAAKLDEPSKPAPKEPTGSATPTPEPTTPKAAPKTDPGPEPTTPAEIEHARNQAMIDGRDKDVLKYCEMGKLDDKSNPQALLGCVLAACRLKDADSAHKYEKGLTKAYLDNAARVCSTVQIAL